MKTPTILFVISICSIPALYAGGTREVIRGDIIYHASATAKDEPTALSRAQAQAAWLLSVECGAPPLQTKIFKQTSERLTDGNVLAQIEAGAAFDECEKTRSVSASERTRRSHPVLNRSLALYESQSSVPQPNKVRATRPVVTPSILWTHAQEIGNLQSLESRTQQRLQERERIRAQGL